MTKRTIIITGASAGIGRRTARTFLDAGWRVGLIGRRADALEETADSHPDALVLPCDVTDSKQVEAVFDRAFADWGHLDTLFNNAGAGLKSVPVDETTDDDWARIIGVNVNGMFYCARAAFGRMRKQTPPGGRIINNGSVSVQIPRPGAIAYSASKSAVSGMTRSIALDGRPFGITCGQIDIGNALTELSAQQTRGVPQADGSVKVEPTMDAGHVAETVLHMANLPPEANIPAVTVMASFMPLAGRG